MRLHRTCQARLALHARMRTSAGITLRPQPCVAVAVASKPSFVAFCAVPPRAQPLGPKP